MNSNNIDPNFIHTAFELLRPLWDALLVAVAAAVAWKLKPAPEKQKARAEARAADENADGKALEVDRSEWQFYMDRIDELEALVKATRGDLVALAKWARAVVRSIFREPPPAPERIMGRVEGDPPDIIFTLK
jgi:hypothetical protein